MHKIEKQLLYGVIAVIAVALLWSLTGCAGIPLEDGTVPYYFPGTGVELYSMSPAGDVTESPAGFWDIVGGVVGGVLPDGVSPWWLSALGLLFPRVRQNAKTAGKAVMAGKPWLAAKAAAATVTPFVHTPAPEPPKTT